MHPIFYKQGRNYKFASFATAPKQCRSPPNETGMYRASRLSI